MEKDINGNYFFGDYLGDCQVVEKSFKLGNEINIKAVITDPIDRSFNQYLKKSRVFFLTNDKE